ncbi:hypothetical protein ACO0SA_000015 [Hanseniaspora valbyensis]
MQFNSLLTIVFLLPLINTVFGQYYNTTNSDDEETTTITSKITMYVTMGTETYTYLRTPLAPTYSANSTTNSGSSNGTVYSTGGITSLASSYIPTTTLNGYTNSSSF